MSDKAAGVVLSRSCVPVEWLSYFDNYHPQADVNETDAQRVPVVDQFVRELRDVWIYEVLQRVSTKTVMVSREIYVDAEGNAFFADRDPDTEPPRTPLSPIKHRSPKNNPGGAAGATISCPQTDEDGKALFARLYCSRFRLPSRAVERLESDRKVVAALRKHVAPLWEWESRVNEASPLISSDGYSLVETPLYFAPGAEKAENDTAGRAESFQVWVGADPLTLAESCGAVYLDARQEHLDKFQPDTKGGRDRISQIMLARLLEGTIIKDPSVKKKYGRYLRDTAITKAVKADKDQSWAAVKKYEQAAARLCKVLDSALFKHVLDAATDDELGEECVHKNPQDPPRSQAVSEAVSALGTATMLLEESRAGRALLWSWNDEAEKHPNHFVNRIILPALDPNKAVYKPLFKGVRWGSKAMAGLVKVALEHRVAVRRLPTRRAIAELIQPLVAHVIPDGAASHVMDLEFVDALLHEVEVTVQKTRLSKKFTVTAVVPGDDLRKLVADWHDAGELTESKSVQTFFDGKAYGALLLDSVNVVLAMNAISEARGDKEYAKAIIGAEAAAVSLLANVAEQVLDSKWVKSQFGPTELELLGVKRVLFGVRTVVSLWYIGTNATAAISEFRSGDTDRAIALSVAAAAELAGLMAQFWWLAAPASVAAPWLIAGASAVAAGAYIVATLTDDDPLISFLERCDWGKKRYADAEKQYGWAESKVGEWGADLDGQGRTLIRLLVGLEATWGPNWPDTQVTWRMQEPSATLSVAWETVYKTKAKPFIRGRAVLTGNELGSKKTLSIRSAHDYTRESGIDKVLVHLEYRPYAGGPPISMSCTVMENGFGVLSGKVVDVKQQP